MELKCAPNWLPSRGKLFRRLSSYIFGYRLSGFTILLSTDRVFSCDNPGNVSSVQTIGILSLNEENLHNLDKTSFRSGDSAWNGVELEQHCMSIA